MQLFDFYELNSPLHRRNPIIKLLALAIIMLIATLDLKPSTPWYDPSLPLVLLGLVVLNLSLFGRIPLFDILRRLLPLSLLAVPFVLFNTLYFDPTRVSSPTLLLHFALWDVYREALISGLALGIRVLTYFSCSMAFVMTTDPADFAISLIRQLGIPYRFGYAILVSYRFLPIMRSEFDTIRAAHRIRGVGEHPGLRGRLQQLQRYSVPLLATAIRKSERAAIAMDSRGFAGGPERTYYRQTHISGTDWAFLFTVIGLLLILLDGLFLLGLIDGLRIVPST